MKIIRIITVIIIIIIGGIMISNDIKGSEIVLLLGTFIGLFLGVKNYKEKTRN